MYWKTVAAGLLASLTIALGPGTASAQSADVSVLVTARVVRGLTVATEGGDLLATAPAGDSLRVRVDAQGPWLLRVVADGVMLPSPAASPGSRGGVAEAGSAASAAGLSLLRLALGLSGSGQTRLTLPVLPRPALPPHRAAVTVEVAAE